jgi:type VI secretion system protein ImpH
MATTLGQPGTALEIAEVQSADVIVTSGDPFAQIRKLLEDETFLVEFFQAVRLLHRMEKDRNAVGYFSAPHMEAVRFSALPSLMYPPSQLFELERDDNGQYRLLVQFMGLNAAVTILPQVYTEHLMLLEKNKDMAMTEFFDMFNHRLVSLFYRGWEKYRFYIGYEARSEDNVTPRMLDLLGLGTLDLKQRTVLQDQAYLAYAGLLSRHVRSAAGLKQVLEDYFEVPVEIMQFAGTWRSLSAQNLSFLDGKRRASEQLGVGTIVGAEVWDHHGRIRISLGPMKFERYASFLPGHDAYKELNDWVRFYSSGQYEAEVQLILHREEAPMCELGLRGEREPKLGFTSWLKTRMQQRDPGDTLFLLF